MAFDPEKKFVRVTELKQNGFVEFDFAVGEPELFVEMILPASAFDEFCATNRVTFLDQTKRLQVGSAHDEAWQWRLRDAIIRGSGQGSKS